MTKVIDSTNLGYLISKIKSAFWPKSDVVQIGLDNVPTANSEGLVKSGGVKSYVDEKANIAIYTSQPSGGFLPNALYNLGVVSGTATFALASPSDNTVVNHYYWTFETGSAAPTITWPSGIDWIGGAAPTIIADKHYEISILGGIGTYMEV